MQNNPLVSVVMTAWNRESFIGESIASILGQTYGNLELIIIDDGSTDSTDAVVESFKDSRIRFFRRPHLGIVSSANFGIAQANGKYIARLDSDDLSLPDRITLQVSALERSPAAVLCHADSDFFGGDGCGQKHARFVRNSMLVALKMCFMCPIVHSSVMYRKDAFVRAGGYSPKTPVAEDYDLYVRLILDGDFIGLPQKLVKYRMHDASATQRNLALMKQLREEIAVRQLKSFFRFTESQASHHYANLNLSCRERNLRLWIAYGLRALSSSKCWHLEPLAWLGSQTLKILCGKTIGDLFSDKSEIKP